MLARPSTVYVLTPEMFNDEPEEAPTEAAQADEPPAEAEAPRRLTRPVRPERFDDRRPIWLDALPSLAQLEAEIRRHPLGRTLAAICLDLGVSYKLCTGVFWNRLFEAMLDYRGSLTGTLVELHRRETKFEREDWKHPRGMKLPETSHDGIRRVVGFLIGEPPVDAFGPDALLYAAAPCLAATCPAGVSTGPP